MRSGGSLLLLLLLLLFGGAFAHCNSGVILTDVYDGNCFSFHDHDKACKEPQNRFFYNVINERCESFVDYGCPAILNRYNSMEQCQEYCAPKNVCHLPLDQGQCQAKKQRWFFDSKTKSCKSLIFKGCGGNANNFEKKWLCERTCVRSRGRLEPQAPPKVSVEESRDASC